MRQRRTINNMQPPNPQFDAIPTFRRMMVFIDGENLIMRFQDMKKTYKINEHLFQNDTSIINDVYVWNWHMLPCVGMHEVIRCTLYTYVQGDPVKTKDVENTIRILTFPKHRNSMLPNLITPCIFNKKKGGKAKGVDIGICVDALSHAARDHYDTAVIISGDKDYLKLLKEIQSYGKQCYICAFSEGLSDELKNAADCFYLLDNPFFGENKISV